MNAPTILIEIDICRIDTSPAGLTAIDWRTARALIATISSTIVIPSIKVVDLSLIVPSSSKILTVTTVLVIDIARARNIESKKLNPSVWATKYTISNVPKDSGSAIITEILPTDLSLAIGNSVPITNNSIIIPNSANMFTVSILRIRLNGGV
jgi:hypothetical protein